MSSKSDPLFIEYITSHIQTRTWRTANTTEQLFIYKLALYEHVTTEHLQTSLVRTRNNWTVIYFYKLALYEHVTTEQSFIALQHVTTSQISLVRTCNNWTVIYLQISLVRIT